MPFSHVYTIESLGGETPEGAQAKAAAEAATRLPRDGVLDHQGATVGFYGATPQPRPTAPTAADNQVISTTTYGADVAAVIENLRTRVNELEAKLRSVGLIT